MPQHAVSSSYYSTSGSGTSASGSRLPPGAAAADPTRSAYGDEGSGSGSIVHAVSSAGYPCRRSLLPRSSWSWSSWSGRSSRRSGKTGTAVGEGGADARGVHTCAAGVVEVRHASHVDFPSRADWTHAPRIPALFRIQFHKNNVIHFISGLDLHTLTFTHTIYS
jgi:hypothetical protein